MEDNQKQIAYRTGVFVLVVLVVLTLGEFALGAIAKTWWQPLILIALFKAIMIMRDYMHLPRLFAADEGEHE